MGFNIKIIFDLMYLSQSEEETGEKTKKSREK